MNRATFAVLALTVVMLSVPCSAQYQSSDRSLFGLHAMIYLPSDQFVKSAGDAWVGPSVDYNLTFDNNDRPTTVISLGWAASDDSLGKGKYAPLTITRLKYFGNDANSWYVGAGVGAYFTNFKGWDLSTLTYESISDTKLGFNIRAGRQLGSTWYAEIRYDITGSSDLRSGKKMDFSGLTLSVGTRVLY